MKDKREPLILTTRRYQNVFDDRERLREELGKFEHLLPFLELAESIEADVLSDLSNTIEGQTVITDRATELAKERTRQKLIEQYAVQKTIELTDEVKEQLRQNFIENEQGRIDREVAAEIASKEERHRHEVAVKTEAELKKLKRDELLEKIGTDEAARVAKRFGELSLVKMKHDLLAEELKAKADILRCVDVADLPNDTVLSIGLDSQSRKGADISACNRILNLRVVDNEIGTLEVMDDSWMTSNESVRRGNALEDSSVLLFAESGAKQNLARFSLGVEPRFVTGDGEHIDLYGYEVQTVKLGEKRIF